MQLSRCVRTHDDAASRVRNLRQIMAHLGDWGDSSSSSSSSPPDGPRSARCCFIQLLSAAVRPHQRSPPLSCCTGWMYRSPIPVASSTTGIVSYSVLATTAYVAVCVAPGGRREEEESGAGQDPRSPVDLVSHVCHIYET